MKTLTVQLEGGSLAEYDDSDGPLTLDVGLVWVTVNYTHGIDYWTSRRVESIAWSFEEEDE